MLQYVDIHGGMAILFNRPKPGPILTIGARHDRDLNPDFHDYVSTALPLSYPYPWVCALVMCVPECVH